MKSFAAIATIAGLGALAVFATHEAQALNTKGRSTVGITTFYDTGLPTGQWLGTDLMLQTTYSRNNIFIADGVGWYQTRLLTGCPNGQSPQDTNWVVAQGTTSGDRTHFCWLNAQPLNVASSIDDI